MKSKDFPFNIGADPEFNIVMQNRMVNAQSFMTKVFDKKYKKAEMGFEIKKSGVLGWDGAARTAEIRPAPAKNPVKFVSHLKDIFEAMGEVSQIFELSVKSNASPIGGHIHFEVPESLMTQKGSGGRVDETKIRKINKIMSSFYVPMLLGDDAINLRLRNKSNYGSLTDYKTQQIKSTRSEDKYNLYTYEFRTPSAEWLTTPKIAHATIAYLGVIYNEILHHPESIKKAKEILITNNKQAEALQALSMTSFIFLTDSILKKIKSNIKNFEFYEQYKEEIDFILNPKKVKEEKEKAEFNILKGWNLYKNSTYTKRDFMGKKRIVEFNKDNNLERLQEIVNIPFNNDDFVANFVKDLKYRILAFNIKPDNQYFVFGIRNGIEKMIVIDKDMKILAGKETLTSKYDAQIITDLFTRISSNFSTQGKENKKCIMIGVPFTDRLNGNTKEFLDLFYQLEKGEGIKGEKLEISTFPEETNVESNIYKAFNTDTSIHSERIDESQVNQIINELNEESN